MKKKLWVLAFICLFIFLGKAYSASEWQRWHAEHEEYLNQLSVTARKIKQIGIETLQKSKYQDKNTKREVIKKVIDDITYIKQQTQYLSPPPDLVRLYRKRLQLLSTDLQLFKALYDNPDMYPKELHQRMLRETLEETRELRRVYIEKGAPPQLVSQLDSVITLMRQRETSIKKFEDKHKRKQSSPWSGITTLFLLITVGALIFLAYKK